jgi:hypothetical protein
MHVLLAILIVPGLIVAYAMILRPLLHRIPEFQKFYAEADGFWAKVWAICGKSVTVAWSYIVGGVGASFALLDPIASALGDPQLNSQVSGALQSNPRFLGYFAIGVSVITIAARLRSISKG